MAEALEQPGSGARLGPVTPEASGASATALPTEPFACPACGQMLGPGCRVCAVCKEPVDPARIRVVPAKPAVADELRPPARTVVPTVPFPWGIFLIVLGFTWFAGGAALRFLGLKQMQMVFAAVQLVSAAWVFYDTRAKRIPRPWRWAVSSLLVWLVIFPWYLARRRHPKASCPFMEAQVSPFFRALVFLVLVLLVLGTVLAYKNIPLPQ